MLKQKIFKTTSIVALSLLLVTPAFAQSPDPSFSPDKLIDDAVFSDTQTFGGAAGIQKFLDTKGSVLANTNADFVAMLKEPDATMLKQGLEDPGATADHKRTAAELIWDASRQSGLNPQVILVTLQKEQGLIESASSQKLTGSSLQRALDHALGFACPDSGGCSDVFPGFYYQLFGNYDASGNRYLGAAKSLMKSFSTAGGRGPVINGAPAKVGDVVTLDNTMGGYENILPQQTITISNLATAALYRFTPHVFNGNYNFWKYFQAWFKYPNGTLLKLANGVDTYIIQNGVKQLVPTFVAQARGLDLNKTIIISPNEFSAYQTDQILGPQDDTIASVIGEGSKYVFIGNIKHPASDLVIKQRGLDPSKVLSISAQDSALFTTGSVLTPKDGTIIRGTADQTVYLVQNGQIQAFSGFTFSQRKVTAKQITLVPDAEIATYQKNGFVAPLDGSLIKSASDGTVYLVQNGQKQPILGDIFKNQGFSFKNVHTLGGEELSGIVVGPFAQPKDYTFFSVGSKNGQLYEFKEGTKHTISAFVAKQRGITPDYVFGTDVAGTWYDGIPVAPRDGTVIKGDATDTVYLVQNAQLKPLTYQAFKNRKITTKKITVLAQAEVDSYAKGDTIAK